jgi:hypothetical protein
LRLRFDLQILKVDVHKYINKFRTVKILIYQRPSFS